MFYEFPIYVISISSILAKGTIFFYRFLDSAKKRTIEKVVLAGRRRLSKDSQ